MQARLSILFATLTLWSALAMAESDCPEARTPQEERTFARNAFAEGERLFSAGDFAGAVERFQCSYSLVPHPNTYFNMAEATEEGGDPRGALALYREYRSLYRDTGDLGEVEARIARLEPIVAALPPEPPPEPEAPPRDEGDPDRGGPASGEGTPAVPPTPQEGDQRSRRRSLRIAGWVTLGLGLALGGAGAGLLGGAQSVYQDFEAERTGDAPEQTRLEALSARGQGLDAGGYALVALGGAALVAAVTLLIIGRRAPGDGGQARLELAPLAAGGLLGLSLSGRF